MSFGNVCRAAQDRCSRGRDGTRGTDRLIPGVRDLTRLGQNACVTILVCLEATPDTWWQAYNALGPECSTGRRSLHPMIGRARRSSWASTRTVCTWMTLSRL